MTWRFVKKKSGNLQWKFVQVRNPEGLVIFTATHTNQPKISIRATKPIKKSSMVRLSSTEYRVFSQTRGSPWICGVCSTICGISWENSFVNWPEFLNPFLFLRVQSISYLIPGFFQTAETAFTKKFDIITYKNFHVYTKKYLFFSVPRQLYLNPLPKLVRFPNPFAFDSWGTWALSITITKYKIKCLIFRRHGLAAILGKRMSHSPRSRSMCSSKKHLWWRFSILNFININTTHCNLLSDPDRPLRHTSIISFHVQS